MTARCLDCRRPLRDPESRTAGRGPECRSKRAPRSPRPTIHHIDGQLTLIELDPPHHQEEP